MGLRLGIEAVHLLEVGLHEEHVEAVLPRGAEAEYALEVEAGVGVVLGLIAEVGGGEQEGAAHRRAVLGLVGQLLKVGRGLVQLVAHVGPVGGIGGGRQLFGTLLAQIGVEHLRVGVVGMLGFHEAQHGVGGDEKSLVGQRFTLDGQLLLRRGCGRLRQAIVEVAAELCRRTERDAEAHYGEKFS